MDLFLENENDVFNLIASFSLFFEEDPDTRNATQGVKTSGCVDPGKASLQMSFATTNLPSEASLSPVSPIHCN